MTITIPGLGTGLDTTAIIRSLVSTRQDPITALQSRQTNLNAASTTISNFSSKLSTLATAARALDTTGEFNATSATSSDTTSLVASSTGGTATGSFDVQISQLAKEQRTKSNTFASTSDALGISGTLAFTIGSGSPVSLTVSSTDTLTDIASRISASGARLSASVIYDGSNYRMLVRGLDSGSSNAISFDESGLSGSALGLSTPANTYQNAQNALFTVDGISMSRSTNQVTGAIPNVTLALVKTTSSAVTVNVATDPSSLKTKLQAFVSAYNDVVNTGHNATGYGATKATNPVLSGDRAIRGSLDRLSPLVASSVSGASGAYTTLASVGIKLQNNGTLLFTESTFNAALAADSVSVSKLFVTDSTIGATGIMSSFGTTIDNLTNTGSLVKSRLDGLSSESRRIGTNITKKQLDLTAYSEALTRQFANLESQVGRYKALLDTKIGTWNSTGTL